MVLGGEEEMDGENEEEGKDDSIEGELGSVRVRKVSAERVTGQLARREGPGGDSRFV